MGSRRRSARQVFDLHANSILNGAPLSLGFATSVVIAFYRSGDWSDSMAKVREMVLLEIEHHGPIEAWIIDDTGPFQEGTAFGWGLHGNIAASWASKTIVRSP
jgi:hypothetical protein